MPPAYVKPYVKRQKNDMADAEAICEAVARANMRFVPTKTPEQQSCLMLHRTRHLFIRQQTAVINSIRAHLAEFGIVAPVGRKGVTELLHIVADPSDKRVPEVARACLAALGNQLLSLKEQILGAVHTWHTDAVGGRPPHHKFTARPATLDARCTLKRRRNGHRGASELCPVADIAVRPSASSTQSCCQFVSDDLQCAVKPPSTGRPTPITKLAAGLQSHSTAAATSSARPSRPIDCCFMISAIASA